jgi:iron complex outermembrane receptor protein
MNRPHRAGYGSMRPTMSVPSGPLPNRPDALCLIGSGSTALESISFVADHAVRANFLSCMRNYLRVLISTFLAQPLLPLMTPARNAPVIRSRLSGWGALMRWSIALALCGLCSLSLAADPAHASIKKDTRIPSEGLGVALETLARDYDFQVLYRTEIVKDLKTHGAIGSLTSDEALTKVLTGTGLTYKYLDGQTVTVIPIADVTGATATDQNQTTPQDNSQGGGKNSSQDFRVAQVDQGSTPNSPPLGTSQPEKAGEPIQLAEVVVTAQKREERVQDVPVPVTVLNADSLAANDQFRLQDYYSSVPGLNIQFSSSAGAPTLSIRGITTGGQGNPSVGITVDDVPYGSSTYIGGGYLTPDIDPSDLQRIEVLRGPQGTLYGASSIGGLVKYVTVDPSTDALTGRIESGIDDVYNGAEPGYSARGAVNVPISDTLAVRASGYTRLDPGYIDNIQTDQDGANWANVYGGHLSALWRPSSDFSIKLSALLQENESHGSNLVDSAPGYGEWQQSFLRGTGGYSQRFQAYAATVKAKLGVFDLTSVTGYGSNTTGLFYDVSSAYGGYIDGIYGTTGSGVPYRSNLENTKLSQEFRLSSSIGAHFDWLAGLFYTHESSSQATNLFAENPITGEYLTTNATTGAFVGQALYFNSPSTYAEYAGFLDLTYRFTDSFDVQVGGRKSSIKESDSAVTSGAFEGGVTVLTPESSAKDNPFTYLVTPRFKITDDVMAYARIASGYRPGGPNSNAAFLGIPPQYGHDTTENYDLGLKADVLDHMVTFDAALYYIDWKNVQITETVFAHGGSSEYIGNGGGAESKGAELSAEVRPARGLTVSGWIAINDATLTKALPPAGVPGDRLPFDSRFSGNLSIEQEFPITAGATGFIGATETYVSSFLGNFQPTAALRETFSPYAKTDLRAGVKYGSWTTNLYANNATNKLAPLDGGADFGFASPNTFIYLQPRTVGLSVAKAF